MPKTTTKKSDGRTSRGALARTARREQLLATARQVFGRHGYHATSVDDIIAAAGVARGTFYLHFVGKRALFDELVDGFFALLKQRVRPVDVSPGAPTPAAQLAEICRHILGTLMANADLTRILLREAAGVDDELDRKLAEFYGRLLRMLEHALETGGTIGLVRPGDVGPRARMILGSVKELVAWLLEKVERGELVDLESAVTGLIEFNLSGVRH